MYEEQSLWKVRQGGVWPRYVVTKTDRLSDLAAALPMVDSDHILRGDTVRLLGPVWVDVPAPTPEPEPEPEPEPLPDVDDSTDLPEPLRVVDLGPNELGGLDSFALAGTLYRLHGTWTMYNIRRNWKGVAEHPIVIQGADDFLFTPNLWGETEGANAILDIQGEHVILDNLTFDGGTVCRGRLLNIASAPDRGISRNIRVQRCLFTRSWQSAVVAQGEGLAFIANTLRDNCRVNAAHNLKGNWPYTIGTWPYRAVKDGPYLFNDGAAFIGNEVIENHGEGIHPSYASDVRVMLNAVRDNLYANIALNNTAYAVVQDNAIGGELQWRGAWNDLPYGIRIWVEKTGVMPMQPNDAIQIVDNTITGGPRLRVGIAWKAQFDNPAVENTYSDMLIRGNTISDMTEYRVKIDSVSSADKPSGCVSDIPPAADAVYGDVDGWEFNAIG